MAPGRSDIHAQPLMAFINAGFDRAVGRENMFETLDGALDTARVILGASSSASGPGAP